VSGDVVIAVSHSGTTEEILRAVDATRALGARTLAVAGRRDSPLGARADAILEVGVEREGGPLGLAPRASVAAQVLALAALGSLLQERRGFTRADYQARHPAGELGRRSR
jgi:arabinose-5-phosphate isomerase